MSTVVKKSISIPKELLAELEEGAKREGISFSQYVVNKITDNTQKPIDPFTLDAKIDGISRLLDKQRELMIELFRLQHYRAELTLYLEQKNLQYASASTNEELQAIPKWSDEQLKDFDEMAFNAATEYFKKFSDDKTE